MLGGFILADVNGSNVNVSSLFCSHGISIFQPSLLVHLRTIKTISGNSMSIKCIFRWHISTHKTCTTRTSSRSACLLDAFSFQGQKKKIQRKWTTPASVTFDPTFVRWTAIMTTTESCKLFAPWFNHI